MWHNYLYYNEKPVYTADVLYNGTQSSDTLEETSDTLWSTAMSDILATLSVSVPKILLVAGIVLATIVIARQLREAVLVGVGRLGMPELIARVAGRIVHAIIIVVGVAIALAQVGWVTAASSFIAGLGLTGAVVGLAVQDIIRSYIAGLMLLYYRPFGVGDDVQIAGIRGAVMAQRLHVTVLRRQDGALVEVPSNTITAQPVINYSRAGLRRLTTQLTIERNIDVTSLTSELNDVVRRATGVAVEPQPTVAVVGMEHDHVVIEVVAWATATDDDNGTARTSIVTTIDRFLAQSQPGKYKKSTIR